MRPEKLSNQANRSGTFVNRPPARTSVPEQCDAPTCERKRSDIESELDQLHGQLDDLSKLGEVVAERLNPALTPEPPGAVSGGCPPEQSGSPLGDTLHSINGRISHFRNRIYRLLDRLQLMLPFLLVIGLHACSTITPACAGGRATHTPKHHYALGYVPDPGWVKGALAFEVSPFRATPVAPSADLTALMAPDDNQGQVGECTGHGLARGTAAAVMKATGSFTLFSPKFIYYNERVIMGTVTQDSGAMIGADGITTLQQQGACLLTSWSMAQNYLQKPPTCAYAEGLKHLVLHAYKVDNRNGQDFERALSAGFPVVIGITLHAEFEDLNASSYVYHGRGAIIGGHCMVAYKYDLKSGLVTIHNQWGDDWGLHDTYQMPLSIVHSSAVDDCWVIDAVAVPSQTSSTQ